MGWLWSGRGKPRSRPRVARAIVEARDAHASVATNLGGATALMERAIWTHQLPAYQEEDWKISAERGPALTGARPAVDVWMGGVAPARKRDFGEVGLLLERAEDTARKLGRSRAEMWEEALRAWLESQTVGASGALDGARPGAVATADLEAERAPRPWLFEARRQRVWGEIDETLGALRTV
jgi:hypothetical protein